MRKYSLIAALFLSPMASALDFDIDCVVNSTTTEHHKIRGLDHTSYLEYNTGETSHNSKQLFSRVYEHESNGSIVAVLHNGYQVYHFPDSYLVVNPDGYVELDTRLQYKCKLNRL
ncbi:hypothetical protein RGL65_004150 [Vibrio parahaemolyticus]|nr:hypothetical protein [Vibrio parahaemolyticus]